MTPETYLDLDNYHWKKTRGHLTAIGTWIRIGGSWKPCMVLIPANGELDERTRPCVITLDHAWIWDETVGDPQQACFRASQYAQCLRMNHQDLRDLIFIASFVADHLGELISQPPYTPPIAPVVAEATLINHTLGTSTETEVRDV